MAERTPEETAAGLPCGWRMADVYGDGDLIAVSPDGETTAWVDDGKFYIGNAEGTTEWAGLPVEVAAVLRGEACK